MICPITWEELKKLFLIIIGLFLILFPKGLFADEMNSIKLRTDLDIWQINLKNTDWTNDYSKLVWNGLEVKLPDTAEDFLSAKALTYLNSTSKKGIDFTKLKNYLDKKIAPKINRAKQDVNIDINKDGKIQFEGFAMSGRELDFEKTFYLIKSAFSDGDENVYIRLPVKITEPEVIIKNDELKNKGIKTLISAGETDFTGSPVNRRNNIRVGLNSFNGQLIAPEEETGAGKILGNIDKSTGYLQELVIKGDKTVPEYGGGLCQVSTTVYRSVLFAGLPITARTNHSYAVSYYDPQGLDATIYPPSVDLKFKNDTSGHILIQTKVEGNKAYSNIYGTPVDRRVNLVGPYYYDYRSIPSPRTEYTDKLKPGEIQKLGEAHQGFKASWYRVISYADSKKDALEHIYSTYEARPKYTLIGTEAKKVIENGT